MKDAFEGSTDQGGAGVAGGEGAPRTLARELTRQVSVGGVTVGGGAPVRVQSMLTAPTSDPDRAVAQAERLHEAGCEIVRAAIPSAASLDGFEEICRRSPMPVVADIHFDHRLAIEAARRGAAGLRINPGNIGSWEKVDAVIDEAGERGIPIRIGVNAGSLGKEVEARAGLTLADKMTLSAAGFVAHFEERGFHDIVLSAKAHDVPTCIEVYRRLSRELPRVPLHLGITEAGTPLQGTVKSAVGIGVLLEEGIGDTMRVSLTADPVEELPVAWGILSALGIRRRGPELVSCPTCARCQVDMIPIAREVERRLGALSLPITVAVMGCEVNGPGEARGADIGVACGRGSGAIFCKGRIVARAPEEGIVDALFGEIESRFAEGALSS